MNKKKLLSLFFLSTFSVSLLAGELFTGFPEQVKPNDKYVFYSHGFIVEGDNPTPEHPRWGVYDYPLVKKSLSDAAYHLIAYHRKKDIQPILHAKELANSVNRLIKAGVKPEQITLLGFSRGGSLSVMASNELKNSKVNVIILAGCGGILRRHSETQAYGRVLSIYETSDKTGSCDHVIERSPNVVDFKELAISTGKEHGAFYLPRKEWVTPVKDWIKSKPSISKQ
ncbi:alpha/beta hydrolase [Pleionea sp. CnH1-48]|uniref:alpha/beta hydrolase n=1 Tax=Pleionea sp. CnH1-48 TaxID=2954494 RepID=UPI002097AC8C|nr:alpha/beta hydrolase [Pleionea sp. CnH1-48]MCO7224743.1 alpha/beta hydrolase [Pleionea sp. CnH1-48]